LNIWRERLKAKSGTYQRSDGYQTQGPNGRKAELFSFISYNRERAKDLAASLMILHYLSAYTKDKSLSNYTPWRRLGGKRRYNFYSLLTSVLYRDEWSASRPGRALASVKGPPAPIEQQAGRAPEPVWTQRLDEKSAASAGNRTPISQSSIISVIILIGLMMESVSTSETSVYFNKTTRHYIPEGSNIQLLLAVRMHIIKTHPPSVNLPVGLNGKFLSLKAIALVFSLQ
jgi:hypothetical protein